MTQNLVTDHYLLRGEGNCVRKQEATTATGSRPLATLTPGNHPGPAAGVEGRALRNLRFWAELGRDMTAEGPRRRGWKLLPHGGLITEWTRQSFSIAG